MQPEELQRLATLHGSPLVEDSRATFVWLGSDPPELKGDFTDWTIPQHFKLVAPDVWQCTWHFKEDAYIEYALFRGEERVPDPLNPNSIDNGVDSRNHYFYMPQGLPSPLATPASAFPRGRITRHQLPCHHFLSGKTRAVWLYNPPVEQPVPLWVIYDGKDYLRRANLVTIIENLVQAGQIAPLALALVDNGGKARMIEYAGGEMTLGWLIEVLLPFAANELNLVNIHQQPGAYGVMGASMGGLMALHTGLRMPGVFGKVLTQSGAFTLGEYQPIVHHLVAHGSVAPLDIWMDVGIYEWLLEPNRQMYAELHERGYRVAYREFHAGHNYTAWSNDLGRGLEALLGANE